VAIREKYAKQQRLGIAGAKNHRMRGGKSADRSGDSPLVKKKKRQGVWQTAAPEPFPDAWPKVVRKSLEKFTAGKPKGRKVGRAHFNRA